MTRKVQLNNVDHPKLRVRTDHGADLGDAMMACPAFPAEFRRLQEFYPIVFSKDGQTGRFRPMALLGLEEKENLFLSSDGGWDAAYLPMFMRMQPFLIGIATSQGGERSLEVHVDLDHPRVSENEGEPVFLEHGGHTEFLREKAELLGDIHEAEQGIAAFSDKLTELELVEPFTLDVTLNNGESGRLAGFYTIAEERLHALGAEELESLQRANYLLPIFMAVASVSQLRSLVERKNKAVGT